MACYGCPYLQNYDVIWRVDANGANGANGADGSVMCIMLWCCAGPELQIRRGDEIVLDEFYSTRTLVYERAEQLKAEGWQHTVASLPASASART